MTDLLLKETILALAGLLFTAPVLSVFGSEFLMIVRREQFWTTRFWVTFPGGRNEMRAKAERTA